MLLPNVEARNHLYLCNHLCNLACTTDRYRYHLTYQCNHMTSVATLSNDLSNVAGIARARAAG